ncbi:MAG: hypothetical protein QOJ98_2054 [Acidobacteriota bacterium]|jgi:hypothetical protein|nr:hypothetical protein [Acidobacteriota bacterium]
MTRKTIGLVVAIFAIQLGGCASIPITRVSVQSFELQKQGLDPTTSIPKLIGVFVDRGFDVKMTNADAGIVTTEYKKFASAGTEPPFDYYMQSRAKIRVTKGLTSVQLTPVLKEQNRMNAAAYTEHELEYFQGAAEDMADVASMNPQTGWRHRSQILFMNVVADTAQTFGLNIDDVVQNVTTTPANAREFED